MLALENRHSTWSMPPVIWADVRKPPSLLRFMIHSARHPDTDTLTHALRLPGYGWLVQIPRGKFNVLEHQPWPSMLLAVCFLNDVKCFYPRNILRDHSYMMQTGITWCMIKCVWEMTMLSRGKRVAFAREFSRDFSDAVINLQVRYAHAAFSRPPDNLDFVAY